MATNANLFQAFKKAYKEAPADPQPQPSNQNPDNSSLSLDPSATNTKQLIPNEQKKPQFSLMPLVQTQNKYEYDPDKYPPDIKMAKEHALARRVSIPAYLLSQLDRKGGDSSPTRQNEPVDLCDCCGCPLKNTQLPLCCSRYELFFLGSGFPLFFDFIVWSLGLMMMIFCISSIFGLASNSKNCDICVKGIEENFSWFVRLSLANNIDNNISMWKEAQMIVNFFCILIILVYLQYFRRSQRKTAFECDFKSLTPADYTLKVSGLPLNFLDYELKEHFKNIGGSILPVNVVKINKTYAINSYMKLLADKTKILDAKRDIEEKLNKNDEETNPKKKLSESQKTQMEANLKIKKEELSKIEKEVKEERNNLMKSYVKFTGTAYVTFETPEQAQFVKRKLKKTFAQRMNILFKKGYQFDSNHFYQGRCLLYVERAPEPNDIIWENLGTSWMEKFKLQWWTFMYTCLVLVFCFFCIFGLTFLQKYITDPNDPKTLNTNVQNLVNALGAIFISVVNYLLNFVIKKFALLEKHFTVTGYDSSIASKKVIAQFMNTAIIYIIISWIKGSWTEKSGLVNQLLNICLSTIFVNSFLFAFDPLYLYRLYLRRKVVKAPEKSMMTQSEAHALFEDPSLDIPNLYSGVINVMLFSAFYATLEPLVILFAIITLCIYYWIFKIILVRRSSIPVELGKKIAYDMIEYIEYVPFAYALGDVLFNIKFYDYANPWSITALCLCCVNFIVPMAMVNKKIFSLDEKHKLIQASADYRRDFNTSRINFTFEYDRLNPVTQPKAVEEWVSLVEKKGSYEEEPDPDQQKKFAKGLFTTLKKSVTEELREEEKKNEDGDEKKTVDHEAIEVLPRTETEEGDTGLENYFMFKKKVVPKQEAGEDKSKNNIMKMYQNQQKPKNLFLGALQKKK